MPCGGIWPIKPDNDPRSRCWVCDKPGSNLCVEEWDAVLHSSCLDAFMETDEGRLIIRHSHDIITVDENDQPIRWRPIERTPYADASGRWKFAPNQPVIVELPPWQSDDAARLIRARIGGPATTPQPVIGRMWSVVLEAPPSNEYPFLIITVPERTITEDNEE